jgi:LysR family hydrogen peroxide-inducible transcriptional activator
MASTLAGLSLRDLEYAVAVAGQQHFGRAAQHCAVSQPALSEQIRKLETLLGTPLFERGRHVHTTARGHALLRQAERVLAEAHGLIEMAREISEPLTGAFHLGAIQTLGPYYLPFLLRQLRGSFPRLALRLTEGQTDELLDAVRAGQIDAALIAIPLDLEGLAMEPVFFEPFHLVCPAGHRLSGLSRLRLRDLDGDDLILLEEGHCLRNQALALCQTAPQARLATSVETLWHMIAAGEGYSLLPALSTANRATMADLVTCRSLPDPAAGRTIALAWRSTDPRGAEYRDLAAMLRRDRPDGVQEPPA